MGWGREKVRGWREARLMKGRKVKRRRRGEGPKEKKKRRTSREFDPHLVAIHEVLF